MSAPSLTGRRLRPVALASWLVGFVCLTSPAGLLADGPRDNDPNQVRRVPAQGIELSPTDVRLLTTELEALGNKIEQLERRQDAQTLRLLPDVKIFHRAVSDALSYREFFKPAEVEAAKQLLKLGQTRADQLAGGSAPWTTARGLVVRGYVSRLDGSVQPYGLVVPESYTAQTPHRYRLDIWFHGRGETLSEVNFLHQRLHQAGQFTPADTIVLHPYGRYSNAFKFAGEVDVLEALEAVRDHYRVDDRRTSVRGFSMGGAACWQFAVHYADRWFAANPGAGFSETPRFLEFFQKETLNPTWWERKLWQMYDCNLWAGNLVHCPTVAYSGEDDIQKQAADVMEQALAEQGLRLVHVIGPKTGHRYHPEAKDTVERLMDSIAGHGRDEMPRRVRLTTYTLKYNRMHWLTIDALDEHWRKSHVDAEVLGDNRIRVTTENVAALTLEMPAGWAPLAVDRPVDLVLDGQYVGQQTAWSDRSFRVSLHRDAAQWRIGPAPDAATRKRHDLQGPIDDALMDSFLFVKPSGQASHAAVDEWSRGELERAVEHWRRHFRGHARVKADRDLTDQDIAQHHLILWGDPASNQLLGRIADRLPIAWNPRQIEVGSRAYPAEHHALIAICPNPLNPRRYVVLNSSFTFREYAYLNNARQVPMLPDWAVVDLRTPPGTVWPGKIVDADFFDEHWQVKPPPAVH